MATSAEIISYSASVEADGVHRTHVDFLVDGSLRRETIIYAAIPTSMTELHTPVEAERLALETTYVVTNADGTTTTL